MLVSKCENWRANVPCNVQEINLYKFLVRKPQDLYKLEDLG